MRTAAAPEPPSALVSKATAIATSSLAIIATGLSILGTISGDLERMLRNYPQRTGRGAFWLLIALVLAALALTLYPGTSDLARRRRVQLLALSLIPGAVGLYFAGSAALRTSSIKEQPTVTASISRSQQGLTLKGLVKSSGLRADQHLFARVRQPSLTLDKLKQDDTLIYTQTGPDRSGDAQIPIELNLSPAVTDSPWVIVKAWLGDEPTDECSLEHNAPSGCFFVAVPSTMDARPRLSVSLQGTGTRQAVIVKTLMHGVPIGRGISLVVHGKTRDNKKHALELSFLEPNAARVVEHTIRVPLGARMRLVCVAADAEAPALTLRSPHKMPCGSAARATTAWTQLLLDP
jgi:Tfp pilus assembly protein FimT